MKQAARIGALRDVASLINSGTDLETVLRNLVVAVCRHAGWTMGSIMAIDASHDYAHVVCRHDPARIRKPLPDRWELATSPAIVALQRNEPVYIRDARLSDEFPGYRREAHERDYSTVLVMPMQCDDQDGRPMVLSVISRELFEVSDDDLAFLGLIVHLGTIAVERQHHLLLERDASARLKSALQVQGSFLGQALSGAPVADLAAAVGTIIPNPIVVVDFTANSVVPGRSPNDGLLSDGEWQGIVDEGLGGELARAARSALANGEGSTGTLFVDHASGRLRIAARVERLEVEGQPVGALLIFPAEAESHDLDQMLLDSARFALSVQLMRSFERFRFENRTLEDLFAELVERRWRDATDIVERARRLDLNLAAPARMVIADISDRPGGALGLGAGDLHHGTRRLFAQAGIPVSLLVYDGNLVAIVPADQKGGDRLDKLLPRLASELAHYLGRQPIVLQSDRCAAPADYAAVWTRCCRMIEIAKTFGRSGVLASGDFGPLPMLAAAADVSDVRDFVADNIGVITLHDAEHGTPYLDTLEAYLREGCRPQACAQVMGVHVSTLRYRLSRIEDLFRINVETPERRFAAELAIHLHKMIANTA